MADFSGQRRLPKGVAPVVVAAVVSLPVVFFDAMEALVEPLADGGVLAFAWIVAAFVLLWLFFGVGVLTFASPQPRKDGLLAGALVAAVMLAVLVGVASRWGDFLVIVVLLGALFGSFAVGLGALTGVLAEKAQRASSRRK